MIPAFICPAKPHSVKKAQLKPLMKQRVPPDAGEAGDLSDPCPCQSSRKGELWSRGCRSLVTSPWRWHRDSLVGLCLSWKVLMGSVRAGREQLMLRSLGLQSAPGYAEQWPRMSLKTTSVCDAEPRSVSSSGWWLGHPDVAQAQLFQPCPLLQPCARREGRLGCAQGDPALDQKSFSFMSSKPKTCPTLPTENRLQT